MHSKIQTIRLITKNYYLYKGLYHILTQRGYSVILFDESVNEPCDLFMYSLFEASDPDVLDIIRLTCKSDNDLYAVIFTSPHIATMLTGEQKKLIVSNKISAINLCELIKGFDSRQVELPALSDLEKDIITLYLDGHTTKQIAYHLNKPLKSIYSVRQRALSKMMLPNFLSLAQAHHLL